MHTLGVVSYRNSLPLWKPFAAMGASIQTVLDVPSRLQRMLDAREVEAALLPTVDFSKPKRRLRQRRPAST